MQSGNVILLALKHSSCVRRCDFFNWALQHCGSEELQYQERVDMRQKLTWFVLFIVPIAAALHRTGNVSVAPGDASFKTTTLAVGRFAEIDVFNRFAPNLKDEEHKSVWRSSQRTNGASDVYVQSNVWQPGGSTGWHTHPGHSLIIVTEGTVTGYDAHDPDCKPHVYAQGTGFVDAGGDHVHILRNEGDIVAKTIAVQLIPATAARWIDASDPGNCHF
jgi:hypothetical protein